MYDLYITIHEVETITSAESPIESHCEHTVGQSEEKIKAIEVTVVADPDDALKPWVGDVLSIPSQYPANSICHV